MNTRIEKGAPGAVFALVGMIATAAAVGVVYAAQHALLAFGPVIRAWLLGLHPLLIACMGYALLVAAAVWGMVVIERSRRVRP